VVITTALIPGQAAPLLVTTEMVADMASGSVIVDLAASNGGNCELTKPDDTVVTDGGVRIFGPTNVPSTVPHVASQMYAKNISVFLLHLLQDGSVRIDLGDEITAATLVCRDGGVVNPRVRKALEQRGDHTSPVAEGKVA
jgi:NAD(P) transhydrogenase subunit alpha